MNQAYKLIKPVRISQGGISETTADICIMMKEAVLANATTDSNVPDVPTDTPKEKKDDLPF